MKYLIIIYLLLHLSSNVLGQVDNEPKDIFKSIKTQKLNCSISNNVRVRDDSGTVIDVRNLMNISNLKFKSVIDNYSKKEALLVFLKNELQYGENAWEANIILDYLTQEDCTTMFLYSGYKSKKWTKYGKQNCIKFWNSIPLVMPKYD